MVKLWVTRGLPGSGKSTWAKAWVQGDVTKRAGIERDQLRDMMHERVWKGKDTEDQIVAVQFAAVTALLRSGISVVVSDTCLPDRTFREWEALAIMMGVSCEVKDFRNVPLEVCLERNAQRTGKEFIPKHVILDMHRKFVADLPKPKPVQPKFKTEQDRIEYNNWDMEG